jgi:preprotein translocase subunit SecE
MTLLKALLYILIVFIVIALICYGVDSALAGLADGRIW